MTYKLVAFDMDGVICEDVIFWMKLNEKFGTLEQGKILSKKYLHSDYNKLVEEVVVKLWKGRDAKPYYDLVNSIKYLPGVKETFSYLKKKGYIIAIISAGSIDMARRVQKDFGADYIFANELVIKDNKVSGEFVWPIAHGGHHKATILKNLCNDLKISTKECIFIGDSDTDVEIAEEAGLSIAFNSKSEKLKKVSTYIVDSNNLKDITKYL